MEKEWILMIYKHKEGVTLQKADESDIDFFTELKNESWWGTHRSLIVNSGDQRNWFQSIPSNALFMMSYYNGQKLGVAAYTNIDYLGRTLDIAGTVHKKERGEASFAGFKAGTDFAFEILNMHRLNAEVLETNLAALKIDLGILGFRYEGRKRKAVYKSGIYIDSIVLGLLREDWEKQPRILSYGGVCNINFDLTKARKAVSLTNRILNENIHSQTKEGY